MSQMPDSIYLHKDDKYNASGHYFAKEENYILFENEYDESAMKEYVEYTPVYRLKEAIAKVKKDLALTWEDMKKIDILFIEVTTLFASVGRNKDILERPFYEEVARRFNEQRKK